MRAQHRSRHRLACAGLLAGTTALAGLAVAAPAGAQESGEIRGANSESAIPDSYIVVLEDSEAQAAAVSQAAASLAVEYGGEVRDTYEAVLRGFSVTMPQTQARELAADPRVDYVEQDAMAHAVGTQNNPTWGLDRVDQAELPLDNSYTYPDSAGQDVTAYIIDTGLRTTHEEFGDRASSGYDFIDDDPDASDCDGHGTHVAGTIGSETYGLAKQVDLVGVRVLDCAGNGPWSGVIGGMDWVAQNHQGAAVANMSLGGSPNSSVDSAVQNLIDSGVTVALAAGNSGQDACDISPSRVPEAITVGASDQQDTRSVWGEQSSNYGSCLDIWAPGSQIKSTWNSSDSATNSMGGTSMAAPHVAGAAALHLAINPSASNQEVRDTLVDNATSGALTDIRDGSPNKLLNVGYLTN